MTWPWAADTIVRLRAPKTIDAHGDEQLDWVHAVEVPISGISFAPRDDGDGGTLYALGLIDLTLEDHLLWHGRRFGLVGVPQDWGIGTVVSVEGVDIPGQ